MHLFYLVAYKFFHSSSVFESFPLIHLGLLCFFILCLEFADPIFSSSCLFFTFRNLCLLFLHVYFLCHHFSLFFCIPVTYIATVPHVPSFCLLLLLLWRKWHFIVCHLNWIFLEHSLFFNYDKSYGFEFKFTYSNLSQILLK